MCVGENFNNSAHAPIGDCGGIRSLIGWAEHLYPKKTKEELMDFFRDDYTGADIVDYIYRSAGKRLKKVGG